MSEGNFPPHLAEDCCGGTYRDGIVDPYEVDQVCVCMCGHCCDSLQHEPPECSGVEDCACEACFLS